MAGGFAAEIVAVLAHVLEHVAVAHRHAHDRQFERLQMPLQAQIRHDGGDYARLRQPAVLLPALGDDGQELIAVDQMALLVDDHDPIGVAVERDADCRRASRAPCGTARRARSSRIRG